MITYKREDLIKKTEQLLIHVNSTRKEMKKGEHNYLLNLVVDKISRLEQQRSRIILYKYFDGISNREAVDRLNGLGYKVGIKNYNRKVNNALLELGRIVFGMEREFWEELKMS